MTWRCTAPPERDRAVQVGERQRQRGRRHVHVGLVRPRTRERASSEREQLEVGLHGGARPARTPGRAAPSLQRGVDDATHRFAADARCTSPGPSRDRRARPDGVRATNGASRGGHRSLALRDPLVGALVRRRRPSRRPRREHRGRRARGWARWCVMAFPGELRVVEDVPTHFADLVVTNAPALHRAVGWRDRRAVLRAPGGPPVRLVRGRRLHGRRTVRAARPPRIERVHGAPRVAGAVQPRSFHSMYRAGPIADAADAYDALVREASPIDLVHLGLGPDGHTASLFPGTPALDVQDRFVVINEDAEHPHPRLTFTYPAIADGAARRRHGGRRREARRDAAHRER